MLYPQLAFCPPLRNATSAPSCATVNGPHSPSPPPVGGSGSKAINNGSPVEAMLIIDTNITFSLSLPKKNVRTGSRLHYLPAENLAYEAFDSRLSVYDFREYHKAQPL